MLFFFSWKVELIIFILLLFLLQIPDFAYSPNPHSEYSISILASDSNLFGYCSSLLIDMAYMLTQMGAQVLTVTTQKQNINRR